MEQIQEINSLRIYSKIFGNRLSIDLPKSFDVQEVEVIIIPREIKPVSDRTVHKDDWKNDFLSVSKWDISEDEIKIKSWTLPESQPVCPKTAKRR
ncbi:MAG: hypothetical protein GY710_17200 [Desulfobacteraceae bacterium]|nr:hypothetical protein [Desulfobacteraceae bacterium]